MQAVITIRKAEPHEISRLADIGYDAWETSILPLLSEKSGMRQSERLRLKQAVQDTFDRIIIAEVDGLPVGWCSRARGKAYIPFLFVVPEFQGHGVGTLLLRRMESMIELAGADRVHLETPADNVRAVRFYERQGYRILAMRPDGRPGADPFTSVRLEKQLHPFKGRISSGE